MGKKHSQIARLMFALSGIKAAWKQEASFRTEIVIAAVVVFWMGWSGFPLSVWLLVGLSIALVLSAELVNTAIETVCDALHPDQHPLIKVAKDCASAAVLVTSVNALAVLIGIVIWRFH